MIRLALAQVNATVGDLQGNAEVIPYYLGKADGHSPPAIRAQGRSPREDAGPGYRWTKLSTGGRAPFPFLHGHLGSYRRGGGSASPPLGIEGLRAQERFPGSGAGPVGRGGLLPGGRPGGIGPGTVPGARGLYALAVYLRPLPLLRGKARGIAGHKPGRISHRQHVAILLTHAAPGFQGR